MIYLCGPVEKTSPDEAFYWRDRVIQEFGNICLDPTRNIRDKFDISIEFSDSKLEVNEIVHVDLSDVYNCSIVLANYSDASKQYIGASMELAYARMWHKKIIIWSNWAQDHPFLAYHATIILPELQECIAYARHLIFGDEFERQELTKPVWWPSPCKIK